MVHCQSASMLAFSHGMVTQLVLLSILNVFDKSLINGDRLGIFRFVTCLCIHFIVLCYILFSQTFRCVLHPLVLDSRRRSFDSVIQTFVEILM